MSRKSEGDYIEQFAVKVIYKKHHKREGSGFLVKLSNSTIYLFTAKHNFKIEDDDEHYDVDLKELKNNLGFITVTKGDNKEILEIKSILFEDIKLDFLVFEIKNINLKEEEKIGNSNSFLKDSRFHEEKCCFYGYPKNKDGRAEISLVHTSTKEESNTFLLQRGLNIKNTNYFAGYSGSAVFIKKNEVYYIVGILIKADDELDNFEVIELSKFIDLINEKLSEKSLAPIPIKEHIFDMRDVSDMYALLIKRHPHNSLMQVLSHTFGKEHKYSELIDATDKLEKLNNYTNSTNHFQEIEDRYTQELADIYLMSTFIASIYGDPEKAKEHFKKACYYRPHYNLFLIELDKENSKEKLLISGKVAYSDKDYEYSEQCFIKVLSLKCDYSEKKSIYNYLLNIAKENGEKDKEFNFYYKLFHLSLDNFEKADILYNISLLYRNKEEKLNILEDGDKLIGYEDDSLELKYLIKKEIHYLSPSKEKYKELKRILKSLITIKENYKVELLEMRYFEVQTFTYQLIKPVKILLVSLVGWMIYLFLNKI